MKQFTRPQNLNAAQLMEELAAVDLIVTKIEDRVDGFIYFDVDDEVKAASIVDTHIGQDSVQVLSLEEKLASVGLSLDDLKKGLGLA